MKSTRPLDNDEIRSVSTCFPEVMGSSDTVLLVNFHRGLFTLGASTSGLILVSF